MTNNPTYKEAETEDGQKYKYVEIQPIKKQKPKMVKNTNMLKSRDTR